MSAFDAKAKARKTQLCNLVTFMEMEYKKGNYVIMGGDWNFVLNKVNYEHKTNEKHLFWVYDFPDHILPDSIHVVSSDWRTVRTTNKPYIRGENFTAIVDGYLVSPNVEVISCKTSNLDFDFSDHNPVTLSFNLVNSGLKEV